MRGKMLIIGLLLLCLLPAALAEKQISVLSVSTDNVTLGDVATISLELRPGTGGLFIESTPLARLDTQISTRFAREYACSISSVDCSALDFFYIISSDSSIIGGPSAGAAMAVLTYASLEELPLNASTVMTGTLNSGGLIGPVGGTGTKIDVAKANNFEKVLISVLEQDVFTLRTDIEVVSVRDVEQAIYHFTGREILSPHTIPKIPKQYSQQMETVAQLMCDRSDQIRDVIDRDQLEEINFSIKGADDYRSDAVREAAQNSYYSTASYCFSANLDYQHARLLQRDQQERRGVYRELEKDIEHLNEQLPTSFSNVADLEIFMIVRERLLDASSTLEEIDYENISAQQLSYAVERHNSALVWSSFFGIIPSSELEVSPAYVSRVCSQKLLEAEERLNYLSYTLDLEFAGSYEKAAQAREYQQVGEYELCVFIASQAKAEANAVLSGIYAGDSINSSVDQKLQKISEVLARQTANEHFPIMGYSYFEYAQDLEDRYSANLYAEYALELSTLDIYFPEPRKRFLIDDTRLMILLAGIGIGLALGILLTELYEKAKARRKKRKKRRKR